MELEYSGHVFERYSSTKFHENTSGAAELFRADGWTDMTKLTVAVRNSPYTPKDGSLLCPRGIGLLFCIVDSDAFDIYLLNCNWIATRWQKYSTHLHTNNTQNDTKQTTQQFLEDCGPCPVFASYTLAFALQLRQKHGKTSVRVAERCQLAR
jgi:hypothetical protein